MEPPSYTGGGLVNLVAELEQRLTRGSLSPGLAPSLACQLEATDTYVLVLADGLGCAQLDHPAASSLAEDQAGVLQAPFATTTTVSLATVATGLPPRRHGVLGHLMWLEERVVNTLKWVDPTGAPVRYPTEQLLPSPNLWERLAAAGVEPIVIQPAAFATTPLTRALYRGARFEGFHHPDEAVEATVSLAREPGRMILTYLPQVDFAAHVWGQGSEEYAQALGEVDTVWSHLRSRLPAGVVAVLTSDHGHVDYRPDDKLVIRDRRFDQLTCFGDPRAVLINGPEDLAAELAETTGGTLVPGSDAAPLWGPGPEHPEFSSRRPDWVLFAPDGRLILPKGFDKRLVGYHGGLTPAEVEIPMIVR